MVVPEGESAGSKNHIVEMGSARERRGGGGEEED
jgi:hypothetical protein